MKIYIFLGLKLEKLYFLGNQISDLLIDIIDILKKNVYNFKKSILKNKILSIKVNINESISIIDSKR